MKTYANNPAVKFEDLTEDQRLKCFYKMAKLLQCNVLYFVSWSCSDVNKLFEFQPTSPTSVAVSKK